MVDREVKNTNIIQKMAWKKYFSNKMTANDNIFEK